MPLPTSVWLPTGAERDLNLPAAPLPATVPGASGASPVPAAGSTPPRGSAVLRRRALWRGEPGLPDRPVLVEWLPVAGLSALRAQAQQRRGARHRHLLGLLDVGQADARTAYAICEAPAGLDLAAVVRAAPGRVPPWWSVCVVADAARGLLALHEHLAAGRPLAGARGHGGIGTDTIFVSWDGAVQLLSLAVPGDGSGDALAPEVALSPRLCTPAADVYSLGAVLRELLAAAGPGPGGSDARAVLAPLLGRATAPESHERPPLAWLLRALDDLLAGQGADPRAAGLRAPLERRRALGQVLSALCPSGARNTDEAADDVLDSGLAWPQGLVPLSDGVVSLSASWLAVSPRSLPSLPPAPDGAPVLPLPRRLLAWAAARAALLGLLSLLLSFTAAALLWWFWPAPAPGP